MLYYRDLKQGTLDLSTVEPQVRTELLAGKAIRLSRLFPAEDERETTKRRVRTIRNKAQENFEERGLQTLYLACGMASWENHRGTARPQAPVLLGSMNITTVGASQEEFSFSLSGDMEVNPTLLHFLETEFDASCNHEELERQLHQDDDGRSELEKTYGWLRQAAEHIRGFAITDRIVIGNFAYAKLPMVKDLENSIDELIASDLIASIAGDEEAREKIRDASDSIPEVGPDHSARR